MKITVSDGNIEKTHEFREGTRASEIIADLGFDFPLPCGGRGRCGKCLCMINGREQCACKTALFSDGVIELPNLKMNVVSAEEAVPGADGLVIDIGTTTVAAARFEGGVPTAVWGRKNPQCAYGADVISRVGARDSRPLTKAIRALVAELRRNAGAEVPTVITGNTAMLALLTGMDASGMGVWPFEPPSLFDTEFEGAYLPPCVSAFVGADALCSLLWSGAADSRETALVADLGTNGEIFLCGGGKIFSTSAAAGPALEGAGISCGMAAAEGAIFRVNENCAEVIGNGPARGLCGSGLVDAVALMVKKGFMDEFGHIDRDFELPGSGIRLTQADIRAFQLCKAAISAACRTVMEAAGLRVIDKIYLSGALGKNINVENAVLTGILPPAEKVIPIGNGALLGGAMLFCDENREKLRRLASRVNVINAAENPRFAEIYINEMNFRLNN